MSRARSGQIERKKKRRNCPKPLICQGERQNESPLNFAHEQKSIHIQGVEKKLNVFIGYLVETWNLLSGSPSS